MKKSMLILLTLIIVTLAPPNNNNLLACGTNVPYSGLKCNVDLSFQGLLKLQELIENDNKFIALTFDDGPSKNTTMKLLDVLENFNAKATFFVNGERIRNKIDILEEIHKSNNEIGNHTWSHPVLTKLSIKDQKNEIKKTSKIIKEKLGIDVKWLRPPYGCYNINLINTIDNLNMETILWSIDSLDWKNDTSDTLIKRILDKIHNGAIILLHDHDHHTNTIKALPKLLNKLKASGYSFVTLSEWEERICQLYQKLPYIYELTE